MMRTFLSFACGLVVAALLIGIGFFVAEKRQKTEPRIGRYQLQRGHRIVPNADGYETVFLLDTSTGKTWELGQIAASGVLEWHLISARPESAEEP